MFNFQKVRKTLSISLVSALLVALPLQVFAAKTGISSVQKSQIQVNGKKKKSQRSNALTIIQQKTTNLKKYKIKNVAKAKKALRSEIIDGEILVKYKDNSDRTQVLSTVLKENNIAIISTKNVNKKGVHLLKLKGAKDIKSLTKELKEKHPDLIEQAEPNKKLYSLDLKANEVPVDSLYQYQWGLKNFGQGIGDYYPPGTAGMDLNVEPAWDVTKGNGVTAAVVDTGADLNHSQLVPNLVPGHNFVDPTNPTDNPMDDNGHGTHVSGTIAAVMDQAGVVGVAPQTKIMPLKFLGSDGSGTLDGELAALDYARQQGIKLINASYGSNTPSDMEEQAIQGCNCLFVAAAGNGDAIGNGINNDVYPSYPASYALPNLISVAAINNNGQLTQWSNYGSNSVDVAAPGEAILSTFPGESYALMDGTSMATPHVTGVAALVMSQHPEATPEQVKSILVNSVKKEAWLTNKLKSGGILDAGAALGAGRGSGGGSSDDDIPGVPLGSNPITGTLDQSKDTDDVYQLSLKKGDYVSLSLNGDSGTDFDLYLYDKKATSVSNNNGLLAYSEKSGTSNETVTYLAQEDGTYYIDVYAFAGSGNYTLNVSKGLPSGTYEDNTNSTIFFYSPTKAWAQEKDAKASGGTYTWSDTPGSAALINFNGTGISVGALKNNLQGIAKFTLDGQSSLVDLSSDVAQYYAGVYTQTGLSDGTHYLTVEWTGKAGRATKKSNSGTRINIDQVVINPIKLDLTNSELLVNQTATLTVTNGTTPYTAKPSDATIVDVKETPAGSGIFTITGKKAGTSTISIKDSKGKMSNASVNVYAPLTVNPKSIEIMANESATLTLTGGKASAYQVAADNSSLVNIVVGAKAGTYTIQGKNISGSANLTVSDGVNQDIQVPVKLNPPLDYQMTSSTIGVNDSATLTVMGGLSPYTVTASPTGFVAITAVSGTTNTFSVKGVKAGSTNITIKDKNSKTKSLTVSVVNQSALTIGYHDDTDANIFYKTLANWMNLPEPWSGAFNNHVAKQTLKQGESLSFKVTNLGYTGFVFDDLFKDANGGSADIYVNDGTKDAKVDSINFADTSAGLWWQSEIFNTSKQGTYTIKLMVTSSNLRVSNDLIDILPPPPTNLKTNINADKSVTLTWSAAPSITGAKYAVYRWEDGQTQPDSLTPTGSSLVTGTTFIDKNAITGHSYYYAVSTIYNNLESGAWCQLANPLAIQSTVRMTKGLKVVSQQSSMINANLYKLQQINQKKKTKMKEINLK